MKGWECPKCGKVWAVWITHCDCHIPKQKQGRRWGLYDYPVQKEQGE